MAPTSWLCNSGTKKMFVKIVYPGGRVELLDEPSSASEIMQRNPKFYVTSPYIFQDPFQVLSPDTVLDVGQKYYVVPINTVRKLQRYAAVNPDRMKRMDRKVECVDGDFSGSRSRSTVYESVSKLKEGCFKHFKSGKLGNDEVDDGVIRMNEARMKTIVEV